MALERFPFDFQTTLRSAMDATQTTIPLTSIAGLPTNGPFRLRVNDELIYVTSGLGTLDPTVVRGAEGTIAAAHASAAVVESIITPGALDTLAIPRQYRFKSGRYYTYDPDGATFASATPSLGFIYAHKFIVHERTTFDRASLETTVINAGSAGMRVGVYADDGTVAPGALFADLGLIPTTVAAQNDLTLGTPLTLDPGVWWCASTEQGTGASAAAAATVRYWNATSSTYDSLLGKSGATGSNASVTWRSTAALTTVVAGTALPALYPAAAQNTATPAWFLRAA